MTEAFWDVSRLAGDPARFDAEGFLRNTADWSSELAGQIAPCLGLQLTPRHYAVLASARDFYQRYQRMPTTRVFIKHLSQELGPEMSSSAALMHLFPDTPMRLVAICAGLPKPPNCF